MTAVFSDPSTWAALFARLGSMPGTGARRQVGVWAMGQLRSALGEDLPARWHERHGRLPALVGDPARNAYAYARLVETGLRLHSLGGVLRLPSLMNEWASDLSAIRMLHTLMQLEVAALARSLNATVEFETPIRLPQTSRPADVVISREGYQLIAECFCVHNDQRTREAMAYDQSFGLRLNMACLDVRLSGHYDVRLPPDETDLLLAEVERAASDVKSDGAARDVIRPGIELRLAPWTAPDGTAVVLEGPATPGAEWRRAREKIAGKAQAWSGSPVPVWLRLDLLDGTWLFSDWAQRPLPDKTQWMADLMADAVAGSDIAGVTVSCGERIDPGSRPETYRGRAGITGLRRRLDLLRVRETIIIPLSQAGADRAQLWADLYDGEPGWVARALASASLPGLEEIERGWSLPA